MKEPQKTPQPTNDFQNELDDLHLQLKLIKTQLGNVLDILNQNNNPKHVP